VPPALDGVDGFWPCGLIDKIEKPGFPSGPDESHSRQIMP
jgi:hypothetical protein